MKKLLFLTVILISLLAVSCNHQSAEYIPVTDTASIKYAVKRAQNEITWTAPIEPDALSEEPAGKSNAQFFPAAGLSGMTDEASVYPTLENLGSIDTSGMRRAVLNGVNDFLKELSHKTLTFGSSFFEKPYEGVVILYESSFLPDILSWTVGKPSAAYGPAAFYEVPVQLVTAEGKCNIRIYLNPEKVASDEVVVQQVMFGAVNNGQ